MTNTEAQYRHYWKNHEETLQQTRKYRKEHPEIGYKALRKYQLKNPERPIYYAMKQRCNNPKCKDYYLYGGRGIKFLFKNFDEFIKEIGRRPSKGYSVDRINNNGNYEPGNIRWATPTQQARNRRRTV